MKATCERDKLLHAFQMAASVAPARSPKPILQNVKLEVTKEGAILMGTDLEVGIRIDVPGVAVAVARQRGAAPRPVRQDPHRKLRREARLGERRPEGAGPRPAERVPTPSENPDEYPAVMAFEEKKYHEMPARFFREVVRRTVYATDNESSRYALGGVLVELTAEGITAVATDGRRLARQEGPAKSVGGHVSGDNNDDHSHPGDATARAGAGRQRGEHPIGRPRERHAGAQRPGDGLLAAGRRALSRNGATCSRGAKGC